MTASQKSFRRLIQAARGTLASQLTPTSNHKPLPCFPLKSHHVTTIDTPADFHRRLCNAISNAKHRVHLASLYIGGGSGTQECGFLDALASVDSSVHVQILLDENRARRLVKQNSSNGTEITSSAKAVQQSLHTNGAGLYLFPALPEFKRSLLPSPLNEIAGVFHIKAYVIDDELILSGANLSQEYFTDRQDRYLQIKDGGGGLVDFYCELIEILCQYSFRFQDFSHTRISKRQLVKSLGKLMDGSHHADPTVIDLETENVVAYAVPTFQVPSGFSTLDFPMDAIQTRNLLLAAHEQDDSTCVQLASAYLNPTPKLVSTLSKFKHLKLLTAGYKSHGFAPKPRQPRRGDWVPSIFSALYAELEEKLPHAKLLYYEREGWTFHAKGLWLTESTNGRLLGAVVGSGNYGARSEVLDIESNTILVFPHQETELQTQLMQEWTGMCQYAHEGHAIEFPQTSWKIKAALPMIRDLF